MYRVGPLITQPDEEGDERVVAFEEYDMYDNRMEHPVTATYLNTKRSDSRTAPRFVSQVGLLQSAGKYVGLPVGDDEGRREYLKKRAGMVIERIRAAGTVGDWEVA